MQRGGAGRGGAEDLGDAPEAHLLSTFESSDVLKAVRAVDALLLEPRLPLLRPFLRRAAGIETDEMTEPAAAECTSPVISQLAWERQAG